MSKYGDVAVRATNLCRIHGITPNLAWNQALAHFGYLHKSCPRTAFLGLCENGNVAGISTGRYLIWNNPINKNNAIAIRNLIYRSTPPAIPNGTKKSAWYSIGATKGDLYGVIGVVYSLFDHSLLR